jgi:hypothetical protein
MPSLRYNGDTETADTWPCQLAPLPSHFPSTTLSEVIFSYHYTNFHTVSDGSTVERLGNSKVLRPFRQIVVIKSKMILKIKIGSKMPEPYILGVFVKISSIGKIK